MDAISNVCRRCLNPRLLIFHFFDVIHPMFFQYHGLMGLHLEMTRIIFGLESEFAFGTVDLPASIRPMRTFRI